jgi:hypothetical protein
MSRTYDCPQCGGAAVFQSAIAVFAVCPYCHAMVVRRDVDVESMGRAAILPPDLSPLRIGSTGVFADAGFTLIGRIRRRYEEGAWNEWCAVFHDGRHGWVAEAQGLFMVSLEVALPEGFPEFDSLQPNAVVAIGAATYRVTDRKHTTCIGAEGELPMTAPPGTESWSIDLAGDGAAFACVEFAAGVGRLFAGRTVAFSDLAWRELRPVPGWSEDALEPQRGATTALACPTCAAPVALRAAGLTMSAACGSCGTLIDTATPELRTISRAHEAQAAQIQPAIPIGRRGVLDTIEYEVIGIQRARDDYSAWLEYLLFNPWHGFVWLVTFQGHWSVVRRLVEPPKVAPKGRLRPVDHAWWNGQAFRMFATGTVRTDYVLGEFYWKLRLNDPATVTDFVAPPRILSRESYPQLSEVTWSLGGYIEPETIRQAFRLEGPPRERLGIYLNQPNPHQAKGAALKWLGPLFAMLLLLVQAVSCSRAANERVFDQVFIYRTGVTNPVAVTTPFEVRGGRQALEFRFDAGVENAWLELGIDLIDQDTQQIAASFERGVEYYHGWDDGAWHEGSQTTRHVVPAVKPGRYHLLIDALADPQITELPFRVIVVRDVVLWSNFWIAFALLLAYPIVRLVRAQMFEHARWLESDYSPYGSSEDSGGQDD